MPALDDLVQLCKRLGIQIQVNATHFMTDADFIEGVGGEKPIEEAEYVIGELLKWEAFLDDDDLPF